MNSEIGPVIKENPKLFKDIDDAEFHILATFLLFEKIKGIGFYSVTTLRKKFILVPLYQHDIKQ